MIKYSILIPVNIDNEVRGRNLKFVISHLQKRLYNVDIIIGEMGSTQRVPHYVDITDLKYTFVKHDIFHKSLLLNILARQVDMDCNVIVLHCADILLMPEAYEMAYRYINDEGYDVVYPYAYYNNSETLTLKESETEATMDNLTEIVSRVFPSRSKGNYEGIVFVHKDVFWDAGAENEYLIGHSHEDLERYFRFLRLGYNVRRIPGEAYHLYHPKTFNPDFENNAKEYAYVSSRTRRDLKIYTRTWYWACGLQYIEKTSNSHMKVTRDKDRLRNVGDVDN